MSTTGMPSNGEQERLEYGQLQIADTQNHGPNGQQTWSFRQVSQALGDIANGKPAGDWLTEEDKYIRSCHWHGMSSPCLPGHSLEEVKARSDAMFLPEVTRAVVRDHVQRNIPIDVTAARLGVSERVVEEARCLYAVDDMVLNPAIRPWEPYQDTMIRLSNNGGWSLPTFEDREPIEVQARCEALCLRPCERIQVREDWAVDWPIELTAAELGITRRVVEEAQTLMTLADKHDHISDDEMDDSPLPPETLVVSHAQTSDSETQQEDEELFVGDPMDCSMDVDVDVDEDEVELSPTSTPPTQQFPYVFPVLIDMSGLPGMHSRNLSTSTLIDLSDEALAGVSNSLLKTDPHLPIFRRTMSLPNDFSDDSEEMLPESNNNELLESSSDDDRELDLLTDALDDSEELAVLSKFCDPRRLFIGSETETELAERISRCSLTQNIPQAFTNTTTTTSSSSITQDPLSSTWTWTEQADNHLIALKRSGLDWPQIAALLSGGGCHCTPEQLIHRSQVLGDSFTDAVFGFSDAEIDQLQTLIKRGYAPNQCASVMQRDEQVVLSMWVILRGEGTRLCF